MKIFAMAVGLQLLKRVERGADGERDVAACLPHLVILRSEL